MPSQPSFPHSELEAAPAHSPPSPPFALRHLCKSRSRREVFQTSRYRACSLGSLTLFGKTDAQHRTESQSLFILPFLSRARVPSLTSRRFITLDGCLKLGTWQDSIAPRASERRDQKPGETERDPQRLLLAGPELLSAAAGSTQPASVKTEGDGEGLIGKG